MPNPFGKSRSVDAPYAIYAGYGPFGDGVSATLPLPVDYIKSQLASQE